MILTTPLGIGESRAGADASPRRSDSELGFGWRSSTWRARTPRAAIVLPFFAQTAAHSTHADLQSTYGAEHMLRVERPSARTHTCNYGRLHLPDQTTLVAYRAKRLALSSS